MSLLEVRDLRTCFFTRWGTVKAVDRVSFRLNEGETLGIVGESGSGKSITALSLVRLVPEPAGKIVGGEIRFDGEDLLQKIPREMRLKFVSQYALHGYMGYCRCQIQYVPSSHQ